MTTDTHRFILAVLPSATPVQAELIEELTQINDVKDGELVPTSIDPCRLMYIRRCGEIDRVMAEAARLAGNQRYLEGMA